MARTFQIGRKARGITFSSPAPLNRESLLADRQPGFSERLNLVASSLSPSRVASILDWSTRGNLTWLHEIYDKMETDIDVGGHKQVVTSTLAGGAVKLEQREGFSAGENALAKEYFDFCCMVMANLKTQHRNLTKEFALGYMRGVKAFQMEYKIMQVGAKRLAIPQKVKPISGQRYMWDSNVMSKRHGELMIATSDKPQGEYISAMSEGKVFMISDGHGMGRWDLLGVYRRAVSFWLLKLYVMGWWGDKVEIFGEPIRVGRYPQGTKDAVKTEIEAFLSTMGRTAYALLPDNINLQMLEAGSSANGGLSVHGELIRYLDNKVAFTFLGQSDTSSNPSHGSRARTDSLMNISWDVLVDYAGGVGNAYGEFLRAVLIQNYGEVTDHLVPHARLLVHNPALAERNAAKLTLLTAAGIPVGMDTMYEQTAVERPAPGSLVFLGTGYQEFDESARTNQTVEKESDKPQGSDGGGEADDSEDNKGTDA